jgi:hypothetical protein
MKQAKTVSTKLKYCFYGLSVLGVMVGVISCKNNSQLASVPVHACDHLAADPEDPGRFTTVSGVPSEALAVEANVLAAISVCTEANEKYPDNPRFAYQLGRALAAAGMAEDAEPFLITAAETGYAAAFAILGDLSDDSEESNEFYEIAAARGYGPAKRYLEQVTKTPATNVAIKPRGS